MLPRLPVTRGGPRRLTIYAAAINIGLAVGYLAVRALPAAAGAEPAIPTDWLEIVAIAGVILMPAAVALMSLRGPASLLGGAAIASFAFGVIALWSIGLLSVVVGLLYLIAFLRRTDRQGEELWRRGLVLALVLGGTLGATFGLRLSVEPACWEHSAGADGSATVRLIPLAKAVAPDGTVTYTGEGVTIRRTVGANGAVSDEMTQSSSEPKGTSLSCTSDTTSAAEAVLSFALTGLAVVGSFLLARVRRYSGLHSVIGPSSPV